MRRTMKRWEFKASGHSDEEKTSFISYQLSEEENQEVFFEQQMFWQQETNRFIKKKSDDF